MPALSNLARLAFMTTCVLALSNGKFDNGINTIRIECGIIPSMGDRFVISDEDSPDGNALVVEVSRRVFICRYVNQSEPSLADIISEGAPVIHVKRITDLSS